MRIRGSTPGPLAQLGPHGADPRQTGAVNQISDELVCSFCQKRQSQVRKMIAGPGVFICNDCVQLCYDIIEGELGGPAPGYPRP